MFGVPVSRLAGYAPFLPTPFDAKGRIDRGAFRQLCELQVSEGATALVVGDAAGEATSLDAAEFTSLISAAARIARKRVPVLAGLVSNATLKAAEFARCAEQGGADALLCGAPYYNKPTQEGVFAHFQWIAESTALPIFLHDAPTRTACPIADTTVERLAALPQFIGLVMRPETSRGCRGCAHSLVRIFGFSLATTPARCHSWRKGGDGCLSLAFNVVPGLCRTMYLAYLRGEIARAQRLFHALSPLATFLTRDGNPAGLKAALAALGLMSPVLRRPLVSLAPDGEIAQIVANLRKSHEPYLAVAPRRLLPLLQVSTR